MKLSHFLIAGFLVFFSISVSAQCRSFVKNNCGEAMAGYVIGENFNAAKLMPGDEAEMPMTFYTDQQYRVMVCNHPILKGVEFQLVDSDDQVLFDNSGDISKNAFDFKMAGTDNLTIKIKVHEGGADTGINPQGCVAVMIGTKLD